MKKNGATLFMMKINVMVFASFSGRDLRQELW